MDTPGKEGIFLDYAVINKNVYVQSLKSQQVLIALHKSFDEAYMTNTANKIPPLAKSLQEAGFNNDASSPTDTPVPHKEMNLKVQHLSHDAITPTPSTTASAGLDVYSTIDTLIEPGQHITIPTCIAIQTTINT